MSSDAAKRATAKYQREKMESISIRVRKAERLYDRIKQGAVKRGIPTAQYIKQAITSNLDADGITLDSLPPIQATTTGNK